MLHNGKIMLFNVGTEIELFEFDSTQSEAEGQWLQDVLVRSAPDADLIGMEPQEWAHGAELKLSLSLSKLAGGEDFSISGKLEAVVDTICGRCTELVKVKRQGDFHLYLKQVTKIQDDELDSGDPDLLFVDSPNFDLREAIAEQLMMLEPFAEVPESDFQGKTHICSENQSISSGQESSFEAKSAFSKLATLKQGDS